MKPAKPTVLVIFGITGDLASRMLLPALYHLEQDSLLPDSFKIVGTSRHELKPDDIRDKIQPFIEKLDGQVDGEVLSRLQQRLATVQMDPTDTEDYGRLGATLEQIESQFGVCMKRMFYLAIPPNVFDDVITSVGKTGLDKCEHDERGRLLIEKPFGNDVASAQHLIELLGRYFDEQQIYRIDHFLAKDTVQNILYFRFHNPIVRDIWNSRFIDHVQITVAEDIDIANRAEFYEQTGALRDMIQSHLLQLVAMVTMKEPTSLDSADIRAEREASLAALKVFTPEMARTNVLGGQYEGYRGEVGNPNSNVETFVALKLEVDNERWSGAPIYLRTGKALASKVTEITLLYGDDDDAKADSLNQLIIRMHPNEGIALKLIAKKPGLEEEIQTIVMDYCYSDFETGKVKHDAYEKLLLDSMRDEQTLFPSANEIMDSWRFIQAILDHWKEHQTQPEVYAKGSWGPDNANDVLAGEQVGWLALDNNICRPRSATEN